MAKPKLFYHYTSLSTLLSIVETNTIRLCNIRFMNDGNEFTYGKSVFMDMLKAQLQNDQEIDKVNSCFSNRIFPCVSTFAFCLSSLRDAFTQWRLYGDSGYGVAIGFDRQILRKVEDCDLVQVLYDTKRQSKVLTEVVNMLASDTDCLINTVLGIQGKLEPLIASLKQAEFSAEAEWRILTRAADFDDLSDGPGPQSLINASFENIDYFARKGLLVPFVQKALPEDAIREVIVGPSAIKDENVASIESWLRRNGHPLVRVEASKIAFHN